MLAAIKEIINPDVVIERNTAKNELMLKEDGADSKTGRSDPSSKRLGRHRLSYRTPASPGALHCREHLESSRRVLIRRAGSQRRTFDRNGQADFARF